VSDTPLTDDIARGNHVVPTEFAQDLERRLAELEKRFRDKCMKETRLQCQLDERWGMRRELEAALGVTAGMENDESLRVGLQAIKKLQDERDEARIIAEDLLEKNAKQAVEIVRLREAAE
jgi:hypothetical protein